MNTDRDYDDRLHTVISTLIVHAPELPQPIHEAFLILALHVARNHIIYEYCVKEL